MYCHQEPTDKCRLHVFVLSYAAAQFWSQLSAVAARRQKYAILFPLLHGSCLSIQDDDQHSVTMEVICEAV